MMLKILKKYMKVTTIHGFWYIADSKNVLERTIWIVLTITSFGLAGILIGSNLKEARNNPITTSVSKVPVQGIPFPAVTISAAYQDNPYRLFENVLNLVEFDCYLDDLDCLERTKAVRSEVMPHIQEVLDDIQSNLLFILGIRATAGTIHETLSMEKFLITNYLCKFHHTCLDISMLGNLAKAYDDKTIDANYLRKNLLKALSKDFRSPKEYLSNRLNQFIIEQGFNYEEVNISTLDHVQCETVLSKTNLTTKALIYVTSIARMLACSHEIHLGSLYDVNKELKLGQLLPHSSLESPPGIPTLEKWSSFLPTITGRQARFSPISLYTYIYGQEGAILSHKNSDDIPCPFLSAENMTHCFSSSNSSCCKLEKEISNNIRTAMKLVKYSIWPHSKVSTEKSEVKDADSLAGSLDYSLKKDMRVINTSPIIAACKFGKGKMTTDCDLFSRTFTTNGIGYSFNSAPFWEMYKNTSGTHAFFKEIHEKNGQILPIRNILDKGQAYGLEFYVRHVKTPYNQNIYPENFKPTMTIHTPTSIPDFGGKSLEIEPGYAYDITVTPSLTETENNVFTLERSQWSCSPLFERNQLSRFVHYDQQNCYFECKLNHAVKACNCTPWNFPIGTTETTICHYSVNSKCFQPKMEEPIDFGDCPCPSDCNDIDYNIVPFKSSFKNVYRKGRINLKRLILDIFDLNEFFTFAFHDGKVRLSPENNYSGKDNLEFAMSKLSLVRVSVPTNTINKVIHTKKVTFSSQLATIGGILGLFCGMSVLSLAELIFWMVQMVQSCLKGKKRSPQVQANITKTL